MSDSNKKSNKNLMLLALVTILGLLFFNIYQYFQTDKVKKEAIEFRTQVKELEIANTELNETYDASIASLDKLKTENTELNALIEKQKEKLRVQKNKISNYIWTKKELSKAKEQIQSLNSQLDSYVSEINRLKTENQNLQQANVSLARNNNTLTQNNTALKQENSSLASTVQVERNAKNQALSDKKVVEERAATLANQNQRLNNTVDIASAIKVKYVEVTGFDVNEEGTKRKKRRRAKNINTLQLCFVTDANTVNKEENPRFYFRIVGPRGTTLLDNTSGLLDDKNKGTKIRYTKSGTIEYKGEPTTACLDWRSPIKLEKGEYYLEIYNNGYKVNESTFKLK